MAWRTGEVCLTYDEISSKWESYDKKGPSKKDKTDAVGKVPPPVQTDTVAPAILKLAENLLTKAVAVKRGATHPSRKDNKRPNMGSRPSGPNYCNQFNSIRGCRNQQTGTGCVTVDCKRLNLLNGPNLSPFLRDSNAPWLQCSAQGRKYLQRSGPHQDGGTLK